MSEVIRVMDDIDFAADPVEDLEVRLASLQAAGHRVVPVRYSGQTAWIILRYDDLAETFLNEQQLPAAPFYERMAMPAQGRTLLAMKGEQHRLNRALVAGALQPAAIRRCVESLLIPTANRLIDAFAAPGPLDLVAAYTHPYPFRIISGMLGIPVSDERHLLELTNLLFKFPTEPERALAARAEISAYLQPVIDERRLHPGDDIISHLATAEVESQRLSNEEILSFLRLLYPAGADTTYLGMGSMMRDVLSDRRLYQELCDHPEKRDAAVEESLRRNAPVALQPRFTENAVTIAGVEIPADSWLLYGISPANRDPDMFASPSEFSLDRSANRHITFGYGPHFCLGRHLARAELQVSLGLLLDRLPGLRLVGDEFVPSTSAVLRGVRKMLVEFDEVLPIAASRIG